SFFRTRRRPGVHTLSLHDALPIWSSQLTGTWRQAPLAGSQRSVVHGLLSSQLTRACSHWPVSGLHRSSVHGLLSSQLTGTPRQTTPSPGIWTHLSPCVQGSPSLHTCPTI